MPARQLRNLLSLLLPVLGGAGGVVAAGAGPVSRSAVGSTLSGRDDVFRAFDRDDTGAAPWWSVPATESARPGPGPRGSLFSNWSSIGPFGGEVADVAVSPTDPSLVLAGLAPSMGGGTLYLSHDGGSHWNEVAAFTNTGVYDIEFSPTGTIYVGTDLSVWKSTDGGTSWTQLNLGIGLNEQVFEVSIDPTTETTLWVGLADAGGPQTQTVLRSADGGATWVNRTPPMSPLSCKGIAIKRTDSNRVYACFAGWLGGGAL